MLPCFSSCDFSLPWKLLLTFFSRLICIYLSRQLNYLTRKPSLKPYIGLSEYLHCFHNTGHESLHYQLLLNLFVDVSFFPCSSGAMCLSFYNPWESNTELTLVSKHLLIVLQESFPLTEFACISQVSAQEPYSILL